MLFQNPGQQASKWSNAVIWTSTEPALMMALIHPPSSSILKATCSYWNVMMPEG